MSFLAPKWDAANGHYSIEMTNDFKANRNTYLLITKDSLGSTAFSNMDAVHNATDDIVRMLIDEGTENKWFSKLPSHEQLMKRVRHSFSRLAAESEKHVVLSGLYMTPKLLTFRWVPITVASDAPPLCFDESEDESESDVGTEPELEESNLPVVALRDSTQESHEEYLLTRLRAAKAKVETEQLRIEYFETTGRMPPDSDSETDEE